MDTETHKKGLECFDEKRGRQVRMGTPSSTGFSMVGGGTAFLATVDQGLFCMSWEQRGADGRTQAGKVKLSLDDARACFGIGADADKCPEDGEELREEHQATVAKPGAFVRWGDRLVLLDQEDTPVVSIFLSTTTVSLIEFVLG